METTPCEVECGGCEAPPADGNDSGVEMNGRCREYVQRSASLNEDGSCGSSVVSGHSSSPCCCHADVDELIRAVRRLAPAPDAEFSGSENGSESSLDGTGRVCRPNCINLKPSTYSTKNAYHHHRQTVSSNCKRASNYSPNSCFSTSPKSNVGISIIKQSAIPKSSLINCVTPKLKTSAIDRTRTVRSSSGSRYRATPTSPDESRWHLDRKTGSSSGNSVLDAYATLPRRKHRAEPARIADKNGVAREPSLNRAASLRKKFLENSMMTTSLTTPTGAPKSLPPYPKARPTKTTIYHEAGTQTLLTNGDVHDESFKIIRETHESRHAYVQVDNEYEINKIVEERMKKTNDEVKRLKNENSKQRTVIEWLEGELSVTKEEKTKLLNKMAAIDHRIFALVKNKGGSEDIISQLEIETNRNNNILVQQQEEISELHDLCATLKKELDNSVHVQKTILEAQRLTETESLELQEFLQTEKTMLSDTMRDLEQEVNTCKSKIADLEQEVSKKDEECSHLIKTSEQLRQENQSLQARLSNLERGSRELLLQQGAVISSASVVLSGIGSRLESLLEQLYTSFNITDNDLEIDAGRYIVSDISEKNKNDNSDKCSRCCVVSKKLTEMLLKAINDATLSKSRPTSYINGSSESQFSNRFSELLTTNRYDSEDEQSSSCATLTESSKRNSLQTLSDELLDPRRMSCDLTFSESFASLSDTLAGRRTDQDVESLLRDFSACSVSGRDLTLLEQVVDVDGAFTKYLKAMFVAQVTNLNEKNEKVN